MAIDPSLPLFYTLDLDVYTPAQTAVTNKPGHMTRPHMTPAVLPAAAAVMATVRASDSGYRSQSTDTPASAVYPPLMSAAFAVDRKMNLDPLGATVSVGWGTVSLSNLGGAFDNAVAVQNSDGRAVTLRAGQRVYDAVRGYWQDPPYSSLALLFSGVAMSWSLSDTTLDIPLRDATYWIEQPLQAVTYTGAGSYGGSADLVGIPLPKVRGTVADIKPVLIDPTNRIYQYTDGPGTVVALYEGSDTNITFQANTTNLYSGTTTSGQYRTDNSRGLFQLGTAPVRTITLSATGAFPTAGMKTTVAAIAQYLLSEDMSLPPGNLDTASFAAVDTAYPYAAGVYFGPTPIAGVAAVGQMLVGAGFKMMPLRSGKLALYALRDVSTGMPVAAFGVDNAVTCSVVGLPDNVNPSPYRFRVGYQRNYNPSPSDTSPAVTSMVRRGYLDNEYRYAGWSSNAVLLAYRRPNDPPQIPSQLNNQADALAVANGLGALWGVRRRLYAVVVPMVVGLAREMGDVVSLTWPTDDLRGSRLGQIVGEQIRSGDAVSTLYVLV